MEHLLSHSSRPNSQQVQMLSTCPDSFLPSLTVLDGDAISMSITHCTPIAGKKSIYESEKCIQVTYDNLILGMFSEVHCNSYIVVSTL